MTTLTIALISGAPVSSAWCQTDREGFHVFLSGEDESTLTQPAPARDAPFEHLSWSGAAALAELIRDPVAAADPEGTGLTPAADDGAPVPPDSIAAVEAGGVTRPPPVGAEDPLPSEAGPLPAFESPRGLDTPAWTPRPGLPVTASVRYRPGHRLSIEGGLTIGTDGLAGGLEVKASLADDLVPSPLTSPTSVAGAAVLALGTTALGAGVGVTGHFQVAPDDDRHGRVQARVEGHLEGTGMSGDTRVQAVWMESGGWAILPEAGVRLDAGLPVAFGVRATGLFGSPRSPLGRIQLTLHQSAAVVFETAFGGVSLTVEPTGLTIAPVAGLTWRPGNLTLEVTARPELGYATGLPWWLLETTPGEGGGLPVGVFVGQARITLDRGDGWWVETRATLGLGDQLWIRDGVRDVAAGGRLALEARGSITVLTSGTLVVGLMPVVDWAGGPPSFEGIRAAASVAAGFWRLTLTGILTTGTRGWPVELLASPQEALDTAGGPQIAVKLEAGTRARGWAEARLYRDEGSGRARAAVEAGFTLGAQ